jgi:hypothetical protein
MNKTSHSRFAFFNIRMLFGVTISFLGIALAIFAVRPVAEQHAPELPHYMPVPTDHSGEESAALGRLEQYWFDRLTFPTGRFNPAWVRAAAAQHARMSTGVPFGHRVTLNLVNPAALSTTSFTALGPQPERMTGCSGCFNYTTTQGRVNAIVLDPTATINGSIVAYLGAVGGGVWKTTNCCSDTTTWSVLTDDPLIGTTAIDALTLDPNDHNTIYAGTGDLNYGSFSMGSQGILKSTDAGATWVVLGADIFGPAYDQPPGQFPQYNAVGKVRVDPNNSNNVVAGTKKGLYFSYNGGVNWTGPCTTNSFNTQRQDITGLELTDMGSGATRIIAAVGVRGFATTVQHDLGLQGANGIYKGTMPIGGCPNDFSLISRNDNGFVFGSQVTGSPYTTGALMNAGTGDPYVSVSSGNQLSRIDLGIAPSNPNYIYAQVGSIAANSNGGCGNTSGCQIGVWSSTDGGDSWAFMAGSAGGSLRNCTNGQGDYPQNWYDQAVAVDPNNADRVYISTFDVWFATRTGTSFNDTTCGYSYSGNAGPVHVDQHALAFLPGSSSILLIGNDGGTHGTTNADMTTSITDPTWFNMDTGLNTIEFYSGDISGNFANAPSPMAVGGAQDNGPSSVTFAGTPTGPVLWQLGLGGDGFSGQIDPMGTTCTQAQGTATTSGAGTAGQQFIVGTQTFTWVATRVNPGEVSVGATTNQAATNIRTAINADISSQVTAGGNQGNVVVTAVVCGSGGNSIPFSNINSANLTFNGTGTLGGTRAGDDIGSLRVWEGNNSGGLSRCVFNCTAPGAAWASSRGSWTGDLQSFILPINMFHGGIPGGDDCDPAGPTSGCGHLIAGTTRVWETIRGAEATVPTSAWYVTNNPTTQNMTKGTLGNRSFINQLKYSPKYDSVAIVGTNDANVWIGFNLGTGAASQGNWIDVTGSNTVVPLRPVLGVALDPRVPAVDVPVGYAAIGGFNANTPTQPGHIFQVTCASNCGTFTWADKTGNLPDIPVDSIIVNPNIPQQVFAGTDFGIYYTDDITVASPVWNRFDNGIPHVMIWDMSIDRGGTTLSVWTRGRGAFVYPLSGPSFVIGDVSAVVGQHVTFWGSQWAKSNKLSGGPAPSAFKGFAQNTTPDPANCGGTWTSDTGGSSNPPATLPSTIRVIVASSVTKSGPIVSGDIPQMAVINVDPGYRPDPGHPGTGTVVSVSCPDSPQSNFSAGEQHRATSTVTTRTAR